MNHFYRGGRALCQTAVNGYGLRTTDGLGFEPAERKQNAAVSSGVTSYGALSALQDYG